MKLWCRNDHLYETRRFEREPDETHCPECGGYLETGMQRNARKKAASRNGRLRDQSEAESVAAEEFRAIVVSLGCWAKDRRPGHDCRGRVEAHHVLPLSWLRKTLADLPENRFLAIAYNPIIGAPLCGGFHAAITAKTERIAFHELDPELVEYAQRLDEEFPGRGILARLEIEAPVAGGARA